MKVNFNIVEILTLPITIMAAISLATGIVLFSPLIFLEKLHMVKFSNNYGFIIGSIFVITTSILLVNLIVKTFKSISEIRAKRRFYATAEQRLRKLNNYQKAIVYGLYSEDNRTHPLPIHDGAVLELEQKMIIGKATSQYLTYDLNNAVFPYLLQPWASDELSDKPDLLNTFKTSFELQSQKGYEQTRNSRRNW